MAVTMVSVTMILRPTILLTVTRAMMIKIIMTNVTLEIIIIHVISGIGRNTDHNTNDDLKRDDGIGNGIEKLR